MNTLRLQHHQTQKQTQTQTLTFNAQLKASLNILQKPAIELQNSILKELQINPVLEDLEINNISVEDLKREPEAHKSNNDNDNENLKEIDFNTNDFSTLKRMSNEMYNHYELENNGQKYTSKEKEKHEHFMNSLTNEISLPEHLIEQLKYSDCPNEEIKGALYLIGSLNSKGFLTEDTSNIARESKIPYKVIEKSKSILQTLEPIGIGAKNIQESLLIQLKNNKLKNSIPFKIVKNHFDLLIRKNSIEISKKLKISVQKVEKAIKDLSNLELNPAKNFNQDFNSIIQPDVFIFKDTFNNWRIKLNTEYIPRLKISNIYIKMLSEKKLNKKEKIFINENIKSGKFLINSIQARQNTIERITEKILKAQIDFFNKGIKHLKPLKMSQIAETLELHDTTISRAISNKHIKTPYGIFPFKYFFNSGFNANGKYLSNKSIQTMIYEIIKTENPHDPYSDQKIVNILKEKNIKIARRTVNQYRKILKIPPKRLRKKV